MTHEEGHWSNSNPKEYRKRKLKEGNDFEEFVKKVFKEVLGITLHVYKTREEQYYIGESREGYEIKYDERVFGENGDPPTNNLYIEIAEKSIPSVKNYSPSGIYRTDNSTEYVIGDHTVLFLFKKKRLQELRRTGKYEERQIPTSRGFLLPVLDVLTEKLCYRKIEI